jgi:hypothetical protein
VQVVIGGRGEATGGIEIGLEGVRGAGVTAECSWRRASLATWLGLKVPARGLLSIGSGRRGKESRWRGEELVDSDLAVSVMMYKNGLCVCDVGDDSGYVVVLMTRQPVPESPHR